MSYWISEDSTEEDFQTLEDILDNLYCSLCCCNDEAPQFLTKEYLAAVADFTKSAKEKLAEIETTLEHITPYSG